MRVVKEEPSRAMKASSTPPLTGCTPPAVPGKFAEDALPATYTSPDIGLTATEKASSLPPPTLPPRYVACARLVREGFRRAMNALTPPPIVGCAPPVVAGKFADVVSPATYTSPEVGLIASA